MNIDSCDMWQVLYQVSPCEIVCLHLQIMKQKNCLCSTTIGDWHIDIERVHRRERKTIDMHNTKKCWQLINAAKEQHQQTDISQPILWKANG